MPTELQETVFERAFRTGDFDPIFLSERHGVAAIVDRFPKLENQVVVLPVESHGAEHWTELPAEVKRRLNVVVDAVSSLLLVHARPGQRVIEHVEGFALPNHPHKVMFTAERGAGAALYGERPSEQQSQALYEQACGRLVLPQAELRVINFDLEQQARLDRPQAV